jgi:hypothetical protein
LLRMDNRIMFDGLEHDDRRGQCKDGLSARSAT